VERRARRDATVSYRSRRFEVPYSLTRRTVRLVGDLHRAQVVGSRMPRGPRWGRLRLWMPWPTWTVPGCARQEASLMKTLQHFGLKHLPLGKGVCAQPGLDEHLPSPRDLDAPRL